MLDKAAAVVASSVVIVVTGTVLLRLSGRKSVLELTLASTVVMFMLGEILSGPGGRCANGDNGDEWQSHH